MVQKPKVKKNSSESSSRTKARAQALRLLYQVEQREESIEKLIEDELILFENVHIQDCECGYLNDCQPRAYYERFGEVPTDYECPHRELTPSMQKTNCPKARSCECKRFYAEKQSCPKPGYPFAGNKGGDPCYCKEYKACAYRAFFDSTSSTPSAYALSLLEGVAQNLATIDAVLSEVSTNWSVHRMPLIDKNILRMAAWEMLFFDEVPTSVTINEAVTLAKEYGSEDSHKFVNGILGKIATNGEEYLASLGGQRYE